MILNHFFDLCYNCNRLTAEEINYLNKQEDRMFFVSTLLPPLFGFCLFHTILYQAYYNQDHESQKLKVMIISWQNRVWLVISIPKIDYEFAEIVSQQTGLQFIVGVPFALLGNNERDIFPICNPNVYFVDYKNDNPAIDADFNKNILIDTEYALIEALIKGEDPKEINFLKAVKKRIM